MPHNFAGYFFERVNEQTTRSVQEKVLKSIPCVRQRAWERKLPLQGNGGI